MGSIERRALSPIVMKGTSIDQEDARRFAIDLLHNYLLGPDSYYLDGPWKDPYSPHKTVLNGIYDPHHPTTKGTLYYKLSDLQSRIVDSDSRAYVASLMDSLKEFRKTFEERINDEEEKKPFENSPDILPDEFLPKGYKNFDRNMEIPSYQDRFPPRQIRTRLIRPRP